uniref:Histone chaperone domain-containing protein n=1 Tax=Psilocybe cubensis TaxID=181762 RepID=A0A8H7Y4H8_PSICU
MSSNITSPSNKSNSAVAGENTTASPSGKGKGKAVDVSNEEEDEEEEEEEEDEEMQSGEEEEEEEEEVRALSTRLACIHACHTHTRRVACMLALNPNYPALTLTLDTQEEDFEEIDPSAILPTGRRTRGVKVDYTSQEALAKAGLQANDDGDDSDEDVEMK